MHICTTPFDKSSFIRTIRVAQKKQHIWLNGNSNYVNRKDWKKTLVLDEQ